MNRKAYAHVACNFNLFIKPEPLFEVRGSQGLRQSRAL